MKLKTPALLVYYAVVVACGSAAAPSSQGGHDSGVESQDSGSSGSMDSGSVSPGNDDASSGSDDGGAGEDAPPCNMITNSGADVSGTSTTATAPMPLGGMVADGTYKLTSVVAYLPLAEDAGAGTLSGTIDVSGTTWQIVGNALGSTEPGTFTFTPSGTSFTLTETCPGSHSVTGTYTATSGTIVLFKSTTLFGDTLTLASTFSM